MQLQILIEQQPADPIYIQLTFVEPLAWEVVRDLAHTTGLTAESYLMVGVGRQGEKATVIFNQSLEEGAPPHTTSGPRGQVTALRGIMVVQGYVPATQEGLGLLLNDPRVYLADTTAVEVQGAVKNDLLWREKEIVGVSLPSPFWSLMWGAD